MKSKYDAFISYSHAMDGDLAPVLQRRLHRFAKPWYKRRALRVFRDQTSLAATPELWGTIVKALDSSRHFVLLASPQAAESEWVAKECAHWLEHRDPSTMLLVITGGELVWCDERKAFDPEASTALPVPLHAAFPEEPLWVDLRKVRSKEQLRAGTPELNAAVLDLAATIHGRPKDELAGEDVSQHRRTMRVAWSAAGLLGVLFLASLTAAVLAFLQLRSAQSRAYAARAQHVVGSDPALALALAIRAAEQDENPYSWQALGRAMRAPLERAAYPGREVLAIDSTGRVAVTHGDGMIELHSLESGERLQAVAWRGVPLCARAGENGGTVFLVDSEGGAWLAELDRGRPGFRRVAEGMLFRERAFGVDGTQAVGFTLSGRCTTFDTSTGEALLDFDTGGTIREALFHERESWILTAGNAGPYRVHSTVTGAVVATLQFEAPVASTRRDESRGPRITRYGFTPDGGGVWLLGTALHIHDAGTGAERLRLPAGAFAFSADGGRVAVAEGGRVGIHSMQTGELRISIPQVSPGQLLFTPDGSWLVARREDQIDLFDTADGKHLRKLPLNPSGDLHPDYVPDFRRRRPEPGPLQLTPGGTLLLGHGSDGLARLLDPATGKPRALYPGAGSAVVAARYWNDGRELVLRAADGTSRIYRNEAREAPPLPRFRVARAVFADDARRIVASTADGAVQLLDAESGAQAVPSGANGEWVLARAEDGELLILDTGSCGPVRALEARAVALLGYSFSPDQSRVLAICTDGGEVHELRLFDTGTGAQLARWSPGKGHEVESAEYGPGGSFFIVRGCSRNIPAAQGSLQFFAANLRPWDEGNRDRLACAWLLDAATLEERPEHQRAGQTLTGAAAAAGGRHLAVVYSDGTARLHHVDCGAHGASSADLPLTNVLEAVFTPADDELLLQGLGRDMQGTEGELRILVMEGSDEQSRRVAQLRNLVEDLQFSPVSGDLLLFSNPHNLTAKIVDAETELRSALLQDVRSPRFTADEKLVVALGSERTVRIFDALTGIELQRMQTGGERIAQFEVSPDCRRVLVVDEKGRLEVFGITARDACRRAMAAMPVTLSEDLLDELID